jgi:hypothetical protein
MGTVLKRFFSGIRIASQEGREWTLLAAFALLVSPLSPAGFSVSAASSDSAHFATVVIRTGADPDSVAVADVNHDGLPDIIAANPNSGTVTVLLGDGKGNFHPAPGSPFPAGHSPSDIAVGDLNGDGNLDLLIPNHQTPYVTVLLGDGKGGFRPAPHSPFATNSRPHPHGAVVDHFCGRNQPLDAVIDSWGSKQIELLLGNGMGDFANGPMFPAGPGSDLPLRSADFDRNGTPDIVIPDTAIGHWDSDKVSVLLGDGKCGFRPAPGSPFPAGAVPWGVAVGDMNNDGNPDLVIIPYGPQVRDPRQIAVTVLVGDGKGRFTPMPGSPLPLPGCAGPRRVAIGDLNGDGIQDFAVTCTRSDNVLLFYGLKGGSYQSSPVYVPSGKEGEVISERGVTIADLTRDGRSDIIVTNGSAGTITLLLNK